MLWNIFSICYSIFVAFGHATMSNYCFYQILQESFNRLSYLLDVFTFTQDDMSLNSTVLNWPKKIAPIFDQNDEVLFLDQNIFFIFGSGIGQWGFLSASTKCCYTLLLLSMQIVVASQKRNESALLEKREKVMLELDKLKRYRIWVIKSPVLFCFCFVFFFSGLNLEINQYDPFTYWTLIPNYCEVHFIIKSTPYISPFQDFM